METPLVPITLFRGLLRFELPGSMSATFIDDINMYSQPVRIATSVQVQPKGVPNVPRIQRLIEKIQALSPEQLAEVDDLVDFLQYKKQARALTQAAMQMSAPALAAAWDNPADEAYDAL